MEGHFRVGATYANGLSKTADAVYDYYESNGYTLNNKINIPVGLQLGASVEWDLKEVASLGPELRLGPAMFIFVNSSGGSLGDTTSFMLPISVSARCTFLPKAKVSPYLRAGVSYIVVTGDLLDDSRVGFEGAGGVEFFRGKPVGFGLEAGYNTCQVTVVGRDVKPVEFFAGIYATIKLGK